ncbi:MAG: D-sedoheptulose 7-phosphate isomerase [Rhodospirillales bacterium]
MNAKVPLAGDFDIAAYFVGELDQHAAVLDATRDLAGAFARLVEVCSASITGGGKIMLFGNGGSAADAQHLATELTVRYRSNRRALPALALTTDSSALTAIGNDLGFEQLFARQIEALGRPGDVALGISTSGRSANVVTGLRVARAAGLVAAGLSGGDGGELVGLADPLLIVPSPVTARIQEMHIMLGQMLCGAIEIALGLVADKAAG